MVLTGTSQEQEFQFFFKSSQVPLKNLTESVWALSGSRSLSWMHGSDALMSFPN